MRGYYNILALCICFIACYQPANGQLNKRYFFFQSRNLVVQEQYTEAISMLNQLIRADSTIAEAWFLRGVAKYYLNDLQGANSDFGRAIVHNPVFSQAYLYRAITYSRLSKFVQALPDYDVAIDLRPNSPDAYYSRGVSYLLMRNPERSIKDLSQSILLDPKNPDAWINRGSAWLMLNDTVQALENYNHAVRLNPFYAESYGKRGRLYLEMKEYDLALQDLDQAVELDSTTSIHLFLRAIAHSEMESPEKAIADLTRTIGMNPNNALAVYNRGLIYWKEGELLLGLEDFDNAANLNPDNVLIYYNRAALLLDLDRPLDAIDDFTNAISLFPDFANAFLGRSIAQRRAGNETEAHRDYVYAQSIAARFSEEHSNPWTDTTKRFDHLIAFSTDFSARSNISLLDEYDSKPVDILPLIRVVAINKAELNTLTQPLEELNRMNQELQNSRLALIMGTPSRFAIHDSVLLAIKAPFENSFLKALRFSVDGRFNQAIEQYTHALKLAPTPPLVQINLAVEKAEMASFIASFEADIGEVSLEQGTRVRSRQQQGSIGSSITFEDSHALLNSALDYLPNHPVINYNKGNLYALSGWMDEAIEHYQMAIDRDRLFAEAYYNKGLIHLMLKDLENGCIELGNAGEHGVRQAYLLIHRFCR